MTMGEFLVALAAMNRRRPFQPYVIEFDSGSQVKIMHPEVVVRQKELFAHLGNNGTSMIFSPYGVCRIVVKS